MSSSIQALSTKKTTTLSTRKAIISSMPRIELFFSSTDELRKRITFLKSKGVSSFNIVNKSNKDDRILQSVKTIQEEFFSSDEEEDDGQNNNVSLLSICAHYSMKYNKSRKMDGAYFQLRDYIDNMNNLGGEGQEEKKEKKKAMKNEILLITGSGPKGKLCSLTALQRLQKEYISSTAATSIHTSSMAVAFNPFFPNEQDYNEERLRLQEKLDTGLVSKVYIQFGTDLERLREALQELMMLQQQQQQQQQEQSSSTTTIPFEICGSIFLPTKKLIAQQKFRPWNGVYLNDEFLSSEYGAKQIVVQMMRLYEEYSCEILIEAPGVRNEKDWDVVEGLLNDRDELLLSKPQMVATVDEKCNGDVVDSGNGNEIVDSSSITSRKRRQTAPTSASAVKKVQQAYISSMKSNLPPTDMPSHVLSKSAIILFHSHDVRLHDNVALQMASHHRKHVIPVFLWSKKEQGLWGVRGCLEVVLKDALCNLDRKLSQYGLKLICREGDDSSTMLRQLCEECSDIGAVYWNKEHTLESRMREEKYQAVLQEMGVESLQCQSSLLYDPTSPFLAAGFHGGHWGTLMPFKRTCEKQLDEPRRPIPRAETFFMLHEWSNQLACIEGH